MSSTKLRLKIITCKHYLHQKLLNFLARPDAPRYLKLGGIVVILVFCILLWWLFSWLWTVVSFHSDPAAYLQAYYNYDTPRYVNTRDFRTPEEAVLDLNSYKEELFELNEFNTYLSDKIPINRKNKDPRTEGCRTAARKLRPDEELVDTSIVIVSYNEELSTLLRTIVSIVMNTPMSSVKEIIIVDDKSDRYELGKQLTNELAQFPFVRLIRNKKREGLIRSKIIGSKAAEGKILIFLDSHVEVLTGWYKPIVDRIMNDPKTVVCPVIAAIDHTSLELIADKYTSLWGAWDWDMVYKWRPIPPREMQRRGFDDSAPIRTPAMAGGLFGIDKDFFFEIGAYDPGMKIWGGENLEMSFRIWMCGGALEINTCSYVGHIFRRGSIIQKTVTGETALQQNTKRAVEVWLDEYKDTHYKAVPANKDVEAGDVISRTLLRQRLKCRSFSWYLREVYPDQLRPDRDFIAYGEARGPGSTCMDSLGLGLGHKVGVWSCHGKGNNQFWKFLLSGIITNDNNCLDGDGENPRNVVMYECHGLGGNQQWFLTENGIIKHGGSGKCLTHDGRHLLLLPCDSSDDRFTWKFSGMSETVLKKFYELHSKQFGYVTNVKKEERRLEIQTRNEENAKKRKEKLKVEEGVKKKEDDEKQKEAARNEQEREKKKQDEDELKEKERQMKEKDKDDEEAELREWRAEKKRREEKKKAEELAREEERKLKAKAEDDKRKELDEMRKEKEVMKQKEDDAKLRQDEEEMKKAEDDKRKELEEMRKEREEMRKEKEAMKQKEDDAKLRQDEEERKKAEDDKRKELEEMMKEKEEMRKEKEEMKETEERIKAEEDKRNELEEIKRNKEDAINNEKEEDVKTNVEEDESKDVDEVQKENIEVKEDPVKLEQQDKEADIKEEDKDSSKEDSKADLSDDAAMKEFLAWKAGQKKE